MELLVPSTGLMELIKPHYPTAGRRGACRGT
jgi:hypothetical protein